MDSGPLKSYRQDKYLLTITQEHLHGQPAELKLTNVNNIST